MLKLLPYNLGLWVLNVHKHCNKRVLSDFTAMSKKNTHKKGKHNANLEAELKIQPASPFTLDKDNNILIKIMAKPGAKQNNITNIVAEGVGVQINAPPSEGEANAELVKYMAAVLGLRKNNVMLDKGFKSRQKTLKIMASTLSVDDVKQKIENEIQQSF